MTERLRNHQAINDLVTEFLSMPIIEAEQPIDSKFHKERYERLLKIAGSEGSSYDHIEIIRLFHFLEVKASQQLDQLIALAIAKDFDGLKRSHLLKGVDSRLIEATEKRRDEFYKGKLRVSSSKGGRQRTQKQQAAYDEHKKWWVEWQKNPSLYKNVTAYDEAMRDKTGAGLETIRRHRKEFKTLGIPNQEKGNQK